MITVKHALTIDLEDYFQVQNLREFFPPSNWDEVPLRLVEPTETLLRLFEENRVQATFFCLGWIAERVPELIKKIASRGHEVACHGYDHQLLHELGEEKFREELVRCRQILEGLSGQAMRSFRACTWSIGAKTPWALSVLCEQGIWHDSSIFPIKHPDYGDPQAPLLAHELEVRPGKAIFELPPLVAKIFGRRLPLGGGGYLRLLPARWISRALRARERSNQPSCIYLHPWELDPEQPRLPITGSRKFRHYVNLAKTQDKLVYLLKRHRFTTLAKVARNWRRERALPDRG